MTISLNIQKKSVAVASPDLSDLQVKKLDAPPSVGSSVASQEISSTLLKTEREYRVAIAQIPCQPGRIDQNTSKIIDYIERARNQGARLVVFPELSIPGYHSMDLLYNESFVARNLEALQKIRSASEGITVIVGFVEPSAGLRAPGGRPRLFNSAAIIHDGKIVDVQQKSLIPTYGIFDEARYFAPGHERKVVEAGGLKLGIEICEDLWSSEYDIDPSSELARKGADLIVNLSASPFHLGKLPVRAAELTRASRDTNLPFIYANLVGGYDGYEGEVLYDGRSMIMAPSGKLKAIASGFKEELLVMDIYAPQELALPEINGAEELHDALVMGIRDYVSRRSSLSGMDIPKVFIGLSGGIDSAVVAALLVEALGPEKVIGVTMPSDYSSEETLSDAHRLAENLGIECKVVPIKDEVNACLSTLRSDANFASPIGGVTEENIQARIRTLNLMAFANRSSGLMVNTGNKTELILNNCTLYGDMAGGFSVLGDVDKDRVYELARFINHRIAQEVIPETTISRVPTAELKPDQADEDVMGAHPAVIAPIAREIFEQNLSLDQARVRFLKDVPDELLRRIFDRMDDFEFKSRQMPPAFRVTPRAYGVGRRVPMNHGFFSTRKE